MSFSFAQSIIPIGLNSEYGNVREIYNIAIGGIKIKSVYAGSFVHIIAVEDNKAIAKFRLRRSK